MKGKYTYKAFGLIFNSEFEIPELISCSGNCDVEISLNKTPDNLEKITSKGVKYQVTKNEFLLEVDSIAKYYVKEGNKVIIELFKTKVDKEVRLFLLGSVFGALFLQRGLLPIHGSTIKFGDIAVIFTGLSGVGKSSIAAHFVKKGFPALADDISVVDQNLEVVPGFPSLKIWSDVLEKLELKNETLKEIRPNVKKYQVPISNNYFTEPLALKKIVMLTTKNSKGFEIEELKGIKKFNVVKNNTFRYRFVKGLDKHQDHFKILNQLLPQIKVYKVSRPQSPLSLKEFGDFLQDKLNLNG